MDNSFFISVVIGLFVLLIIVNFYDIDNKKGNENKTIIVYENSGETVYENPDWYRFGNFGITFEKSGEHITTSNYKVVEITIKGE